MADLRLALKLYAILVFVAALSSFTLVICEDSSKSEEHSEKDVSVPDDSSSQEDSKEKRSREEILFGNQQNKPSGLVDDLMGMSEEKDAQSNAENDKKDEKKNEEGQKTEVTSIEENAEKRAALEEPSQKDSAVESDPENWYNAVPVSSSALQYLSNPPTLHSMSAPAEYTNSLYDQEDIYRRKRQLLAQPLPLRKRRSLRSSLGQMIQKRGIRMPRRSMRLKRQVDMEDLINLLGNDGYYDEQQQISSHSNRRQSRNRMDKRHVPGHFSSYPETPAPEYRYPYTFQHRDDGVLSGVSDFDDTKGDNLDLDNMDDIDSLMLLHPNARYVETPEIALFPYNSREEESEAFQKWLARHATPNIFTVSRRSSPAFYPLDYRYIPGYKKRSIFSHGNRMASHYTPPDSEDTDSDFGKWGHVVQTPEAYASPEDVARLYGLANLMAEGSEDSSAMRKRTV